MAIESRMASGRRWRWIIGIVFCVVFGLWYLRDGWFNPEYQPAGSKHKDQIFNQVATVVLLPGSIVLLVAFAVISKARVVADDRGIDVNSKQMIPWSAITKIDDSSYAKGIVSVFYTRGGQEDKYVIDNYKLSHFDELLDEISSHRPDLLPPENEEEPTEQGSDTEQ
jgi:hypothetical protein